MTSPNTGAQDAGRRPWEQLPGESDLWYGRFQIFLSLGPTRTIQETTRQAGLAKRNKQFGFGMNWTHAARTWRWRERAHAWDAEQRTLLALSERNMRLALRDRRVAVMEDTLERVRATLDTARIDEADQEQARKWLTDLRHFLCDLLVIQRQGFERIDYERGDPYAVAPITADDLRAAQRQLDSDGSTAAILERDQAVADPVQNGSPQYWRWASHRGPHAEPHGEQPGPDTARSNRPLRPTPALLVCTGAGSHPGVALPLWQEVRATSGLEFVRALNVTQTKFSKSLRRARGLGDSFKFLHLALPASPDGVQFTNAPVAAAWLSPRLAGLHVLLLAHYSGEDAPAWAQSVPCVITVAAGCDAQELATFTQVFWEAIGWEEDPGLALEAALAGCSAAARECVRRRR